MAVDRKTAYELRPHAFSAAEAVIPNEPDSLWDLRWAVINKARSYLQLVRPMDALDTIHAYYQNYSANCPESDGNSFTDQPDCEIRFFEANILAELGRYDDADAAFRIAISDFPGDASYYQQVSCYFTRRDRYSDAMFALHQQILAGYSLSHHQYEICREAHHRGEPIPNGFMDRLRHLEHINCPGYVHPADVTEILSTGHYSTSYDLYDEVDVSPDLQTVVDHSA